MIDSSRAQCSAEEAAELVAKRGLAFIGPPWLGEYLLVSQRPSSVVGISAPVRLALRRSLADRLYPRVSRLPNATLGNSYALKLEDLLRQFPAIALQSGSAYRVRMYGLCAVPLGAKYGTDASIEEHTQIYAGLAGSPERSTHLWARFQVELAALSKDVSTASRVRPPRVAVVSLLRHGSIIAEGGLHAATDFIARAGGVNALLGWRSFGVRLDAERLYALDADDVFVVQTLGDSTPTLTSLGASRLGKLRAIAERRAFVLPPDWTMMNSVVATPAYERWMAERLYPGLPGSARIALRRAYEDQIGVVLPDAWLDYALSEPGR